MRTAIAHRSSSSDAASSFLFDELKGAHAALMNAIDELAKLTDGPAPSKDQLVRLRWNISRASLNRRLLWGRIHAHLSSRVDVKERESLFYLQEVDTCLLRRSIGHIGKWTADAVLEDWRGYCRASELMRQKMLEAIGAEKLILYPLLQRA